MNEPLPSYREMFHLMKDLNLRVQKLEKENASLKRYSAARTQKINILTLLNSPKYPSPPVPFLQWIKESVLSSVHASLSVVFEHDLFTGIQDVLNQALSPSKSTDLPFKAFESRTHEFYAFVEPENQWVLLTVPQLDNQIHRILKQFLIDFNTYWLQPNREKINKDETYKDRYVLYYKKILGEDRMTEESLLKKIRKHIYDLCKQKKETLLE